MGNNYYSKVLLRCVFRLRNKLSAEDHSLKASFEAKTLLVDSLVRSLDNTHVDVCEKILIKATSTP